MKEEIEKLLFETELPSKECEALTQKLLCLYNVSHCEKCNDVHNLKVICEDCIKCECNEYM